MKEAEEERRKLLKWRKGKLSVYKLVCIRYLHRGSGSGSEIWSWAAYVWMGEEQHTDCGGSPSPEHTVQTVGLKQPFWSFSFQFNHKRYAQRSPTCVSNERKTGAKYEK